MRACGTDAGRIWKYLHFIWRKAYLESCIIMGDMQKQCSKRILFGRTYLDTCGVAVCLNISPERAFESDDLVYNFVTLCLENGQQNCVFWQKFVAAYLIGKLLRCNSIEGAYDKRKESFYRKNWRLSSVYIGKVNNVCCSRKLVITESSRTCNSRYVYVFRSKIKKSSILFYTCLHLHRLKLWKSSFINKD